MKNNHKKVCIIGAGNIGSRHLQGIKNIKYPLNIYVTDPHQDSLKLAQERYNQISTRIKHNIIYQKNLLNLPSKIDLAIISTNSNVRAKVTKEFLKRCKVRYIIFEKILFDRKSDYKNINKLLQNNQVKAWVNCSMRTQPFYSSLKNLFNLSPIVYYVTGSQLGLITNSIHFIDHIAYLTGDTNFTINLDYLSPKAVKSKRKDFMELYGTFIVNFKKGSMGIFHSDPTGTSPFIIEMHSPNNHVISNDSEKTALISNAKNGWVWQKINTDIPYQSQMTDKIVMSILKFGNCSLPTYRESSKIHLVLHQALLNFTKANINKKLTFIPFT